MQQAYEIERATLVQSPRRRPNGRTSDPRVRPARQTVASDRRVKPALQELESFLASICNGHDVPYDVWDRMLERPFVGTIAANEPCAGAIQCADSRECEALPPSTTPVCLPPTRALGMTCGTARECVQGENKRVLCAIKPNDTNGVCASWDYPSPKGLNESCGSDGDTAKYFSFEQRLVCDETTRRCTPRDIACYHDADCGIDGGICTSMLQCKEPLANGDHCWRDLTCASKRCVGVQPGVSPGTCTP